MSSGKNTFLNAMIAPDGRLTLVSQASNGKNLTQNGERKMRNKTKLIALVLGALVASVALAVTVTVSWQHPTTNTDATPIPATGPGSIASTRIEWGTCIGTAFGVRAGDVVVNGQATTASVPNIGPGTHCFRAYSRNTYGQESGPSNSAQKIVPAPTPNPPTGFSVD